MADALIVGNDFQAYTRRYKDMGDGTFAEVVYNGGSSSVANSPSGDPFFITDIASGTVANLPRELATDSTGVAATGILSLNAMRVYPGLVINKITYFAGSVAAVTPTNQWFCLVDPTSLLVLAVTNDDTTAAWDAAVLPEKTLTLTTPYTVPAGVTRIYSGLMVKAATPPTSMGRTTSVTTITQRAPRITARASTGLTIPLTVGASVAPLTAGFGIPYTIFS